MPIEIRELYIKVTVSAGGEEKGAAARGAALRAGATPARGAADPRQLVGESVEHILEVLRAKGER